MTLDAEFQDRTAAYAPRAVLHLVGRVTESVFSFLGPATAALAQQGTRQTVVLIDDPLHRHLLPKFHESVRLILTSSKGSSADRLNALLDAYCGAADAARPSVAHLHGMVCSLLGAYAARSRGVAVPTYFSPHGSKLLGPLRGLGSAFLWTMRPLIGGFGQRAIVNSGADARSLSQMVHRSIHLIESPVGESFLGRDAAPGVAPQIVTSGRAPNPLGAAQFAQCAVVLADQVPGIRFVWMGAVDLESSARLKAAGVDVQDLRDDAARAACLAQSWIYVAPAGGLGFPSFLTEAMALGLPCVAWKTAYHRDVIDDGVTGYLCRDMGDVLTRVAELLESGPMRLQIGNAAREHAHVRFGSERFRDSLLDLYDASAVHASPRSLDVVAERRAKPRPDASRAHVRRAARAVRAVVSDTILSMVAAAAVLRFARRARSVDRDLTVRTMNNTDASALEGRFIATSAESLRALTCDPHSASAGLAVAWRQDTAVGVAAIRWDGPLDGGLRGMFPTCPEIHSVEVDAACRSAGVGSSLVAFCEGWAIDRGFRFMGASVAVDNVHAYSLYLRLGYIDPDLAAVESVRKPGRRRPHAGQHFLIKALR